MVQGGPSSGIRPRVDLNHLPDDVLGQVFNHLSLKELSELQQVSKSLKHRIDHVGIPNYLAHHPQPHLTIQQPSSSRTPHALVRHNHYINTSLAKHQWHALQVGTTWSQPVIPTLTVTADQVILGVGGKLLIHPITRSSPGQVHGRSNEHKPDDPRNGFDYRAGGDQNGGAVARVRDYPVAKKFSSSEADIIGIVPLSDGQLAVAQYDGTLQRFQVPGTPSAPSAAGPLRSTAHYPHPKNTNIRNLSGDSRDDVLLTMTSAGLVSMFSARSPWTPPGTMPLPSSSTRAWSSLCTTSDLYLPPSAILGLPDRISIHPFHPAGLSSSLSIHPSHILRGPDLPIVSSAYGLVLPPRPSTHHPSTLLSSWYDSHLRIHDLRSASSSPVTTFFDPYTWADGSAMYSAAFVGEYHIAGGGARHGTVSIFDTRYPKVGWSCFSPGGKGSPVYALQGEGGRLWGVTERRAFVLAFDGSGDNEGLVLNEARARREKVLDRPSGWKPRGGKWGWTVRYPAGRNGRYGDNDNGYRDQANLSGNGVGKIDGESVVGYKHSERTVDLFDSLVTP